jgi:hypothetical protein
MKATTRTLVFLVAALGSASAFVGSKIASRPSLLSHRLAAGKPPSGDEKEIDVATKASWYAVEAFGKIFGNKGETDAPLTTTRTSPPRSVAETMARIEKDNEKEYFLSGDVDKLIYDDNCGRCTHTETDGARNKHTASQAKPRQGNGRYD